MVVQCWQCYHDSWNCVSRKGLRKLDIFGGNPESGNTQRIVHATIYHTPRLTGLTGTKSL